MPFSVHSAASLPSPLLTSSHLAAKSQSCSISDAANPFLFPPAPLTSPSQSPHPILPTLSTFTVYPVLINLEISVPKGLLSFTLVVFITRSLYTTLSCFSSPSTLACSCFAPTFAHPRHGHLPRRDLNYLSRPLFSLHAARLSSPISRLPQFSPVRRSLLVNIRIANSSIKPPSAL